MGGIFSAGNLLRLYLGSALLVALTMGALALAGGAERRALQERRREAGAPPGWPGAAPGGPRRGSPR